MPDFEFQPYLDFVQRHYSESQGLYTPTDAVLPLKVQSVEKDDRVSGEQGNDQKSSQKLEQFLVLDGLRKYALGNDREHVLLAGRPGSGKSMALRELVVALASEGQVPVLVQLKGDRSVSELIKAEFRRARVRVADDQIDEWLFDARLVLLLDGVNEIPTEKLRQDLAQFREDNLSVPMVFTTRDLAIGGDLGIWKRFEMKPLSPEQLREFVGKRLPGQGERLLEQLDGGMREIAETPLLLRMLCDVFNPETEKIPSNKSELFEWFDRDYERIKKEVEYIPVSENFWLFKSQILQYLAFSTIQADLEKPTQAWYSFPRNRAVAILEDWLRSRGITDSPTKAALWIKDLVNYHLLQDAAELGKIEFHHQLFQEYYAAEALLVMFENRHFDVMEKERFKHFYLNYLKWTEPIALMLGLPEINQQRAITIVEQALNVDLMLGARLAGEVRSNFQERTVGLVSERKVPNWLKVEMWGKTRSQIALCKLKELSQNQDYSIREIVAEALGYLAFKECIPVLIELLKDNEYVVRITAISSLGIIGHSDSLPYLLEKLEDKNSSVCLEAVKSIAKFNCDTGITSNLLRIVEEKGNKYEFRRMAALTLGEFKTLEIIPKVIYLLTHRNPTVRRLAIELSIQFNDERVVKELQKNLVDRNFFRETLIAVAKTDELTIVVLLKPYLRQENQEICRLSSCALGRLGIKEAIPELLNILKERDPIFLSEAIYSLGICKSEEAIPILKDLLFADQITKSSVVGHSYVSKRTVINALIKINSLSLNQDFLNDLAKTEDSEIFGLLSYFIARKGIREGIPILLNSLENFDSEIQESSAYSLALMGRKEGIPILMKKLRDNGTIERWWIDEALTEVSDPETLKELWGLHISGKTYLTETIRTIQSKCKFYNYEIEQQAEKLRKADRTSLEGGGVDPFAKIEDKLESIDQSIKMSESSRTFHVQGNYIEKVEGGYHEHNYAPQANLKESEQLIQVLQELRQHYPNATDAELFEILLNDFQTMPQKNPQNWQSWSNILSILFAGGVEGLKLICPPAGIPIEVGKRLYDIYQKNPKQLPGT